VAPARRVGAARSSRAMPQALAHGLAATAA